jgi:hypothetical protein
MAIFREGTKGGLEKGRERTVVTDLAQKLRPVNTPDAGNNSFEHEHEDEHDEKEKAQEED